MDEIDFDFEAAKYCHFCGTELVVEDKREFGYNRATGEPVYMYSKKCPNYKDRDFARGHDWLTRYDRV